jgi:branched-chain amino acid transport system ATP-binding protein
MKRKKTMLEIQNLKAGYATVPVLKGVSLEVNKGEIVTLIGANGAGKTTLLRAITGIIPSEAGDVIFAGEDIVKLPTHTIARKGLCLVPEGREIFGEMTVYENLQMGAFSQSDEHCAETLEVVYEMFPVLKNRPRQLGGTLSGGQQQMLAIGRALMARPSILMMDEPSLGLAPIIINEVLDTITRLKSSEVGILLVEQNARKALKIADRGYVLEVGQIVLSGTSEELASNDKVLEAYLGGAN